MDTDPRELLVLKSCDKLWYGFASLRAGARLESMLGGEGIDSQGLACAFMVSAPSSPEYDLGC